MELRARERENVWVWFDEIVNHAEWRERKIYKSESRPFAFFQLYFIPSKIQSWSSSSSLNFFSNSV